VNIRFLRINFRIEISNLDNGMETFFDICLNTRSICLYNITCSLVAKLLNRVTESVQLVGLKTIILSTAYDTLKWDINGTPWKLMIECLLTKKTGKFMSANP